MISMPILFSGSFIAKKSAHEKGYVRINNITHGRSLVAFKPSAVMMDGTSKGVRDVRPPIASFRPSLWGDTFLTFCFDEQVQQKYGEEIEALKKEARSMLMSATSTKLLILVDKLERLGLAYHFETEIEEKLEQVYNSREEDNEDYDLFATALRFRLLRQHQYHVSCDVFDKFVDKENILKETLYSDVAGLLSLYEAAHVRIHDEHILDEVVAFTTHHLSRILPQLEAPLKEKVHNALEYPLHKSPTVLHHRFHISSYEEDESKDELLLRLAKLNFNFLQNVYRNELLQLSKWWNKHDMKSKIPYARDRLVECYIWGVTFHLEPQYSHLRVAIGKVCQLFAIVDDTYDNYATFQEIELFTQALERWNMDEIDLLPDYLKIVYKFIMIVSEEFERSAEKQGKPFAIPYYIESIKQVGRAYVEEQKWFTKQEVPTFEEYLINARFTTLIYVVFIVVIPYLKSATKETIDWLLTYPKLVVSLVELGRLIDDLGSYQRESKEGKILTIVDIYMKEKGVSKEEAFSAFEEIIEDRWKHINTEWVKCRHDVPKEMIVQIVNLAQVAEITYKNNIDGISNPEVYLEPLIAGLLVDPLLL